MGFFEILLLGVTGNVFITENIIQALFIKVLLLATYSCLVHFLDCLYAGPSQQTWPEEEETEATPLISNQIESPKSLGKAVILATVLLLILASWYPLLLYQFNTCPTLSPSQESTIMCSSSPQVYSTTCTLTCTPLYWTADLPNTTCGLGGRWSVQPRLFTCLPQVAAMVGFGRNETTGRIEQATDIYPPTGQSHLPSLPEDIAFGKALLLMPVHGN